MISTWYLGKTSEKYESGNRGAGTVSSGVGDYGGVSYGKWQMSSKLGVVKQFIDSMGYKHAFENLVPGTGPFTTKWKELAKDKSFEAAQHEFIKETHFKIQLNFLEKNGLNLRDRGPCVQDCIWSTSVQFGPNSKLIAKALEGHDLQVLSDKNVVILIQDHKIQNNSTLFHKSSESVRLATLIRAKQEKNDLISLCESAF